MNILSAKNVFSDIFDWFANLSSKLPAIDYKTYFIVVVVLLLGVGLVVALTYFGSYRFKLLVACKKIIGYLDDVEAIDNDNFGDFTAQCFSAKVPSTLRDCWVQYLGVRFGYPSDIVSEQNVYDKEVKRVREIRANIFIAVALILIAIFSFWGYGRLGGNDMGVIFLTGLLLSGVIYLVLVILNKMLSNKCLDVFNNMQEDLDAKVIFQVEKSFATDASPLGDLAAIIDEIIARNTAKDIGFEFADEQTPIEELIANADDDFGGNVAESAEEDKVEDNFQIESAEDETVDGEPENMTIDDILGEEASTESTVEEQQVSDGDAIEAESETETNTDENIEEAVEESNTETPEPVVDDAHNESGDADEQNVDDAIYGVVEDVQEESEPENTSDDEVINGETVETLNDTEEEAKQDDAAPEADEQKKNLNDDEVINSDEPIADSSIEQASEDISESVPEDSASDEESEEKIVEEVAEVETVEASSDIEEQPKAEAEMEEAKADEQNVKPETNEDSNDDEPIIQYVMDGPMDDDDDIVKPAQLVKMPNLVDYMIAQNASSKLKMHIVSKLMASYKKFEDSEEDKKIIIDCIKKLMADLQSKK